MSPASAHRLAEGIAETHGFTLEAVLAPCRKPAMARIRWEIMAAFREVGFSLTEIGLLVRRHHSSVHHGLRQMEKAA